MKKSEIPVISIGKDVHSDYIDDQIPGEFFMSVQRKVPNFVFNYPFRLDDLIMIMCRSGYCELVIDLICYEMEPNDFFFILPGSIVQLKSKSEDFLLYVIGASTTFILDKSMKANVHLFLHIKGNPKIKLNEKDAETLSVFIEFIRNKLTRTEHIYRREIVQALFGGFFYEVSAIFQRSMSLEPQSVNRNEMLFKELMHLIVTYYKTERNVKFYAEKLCLTDKYLTRIIRKISGKTISELIKTALIFDAKSQLRYTRKTIQEISNDLNFPNPSFFSKFFKQHTGMTPKEYRIK